MVALLAQLLLVVLLLGLVALVAWGARAALQPGPGQLPARDRAQLLASAGWAPGHDEVDGVTRVLLRRSYTGPDGLPVVLDLRVFETFPANDPAWEARFTEAMAGARYRCAFLNAEDSLG